MARYTGIAPCTDGSYAVARVDTTAAGTRISWSRWGRAVPLRLILLGRHEICLSVFSRFKRIDSGPAPSGTCRADTAGPFAPYANEAEVAHHCQRLANNLTLAVGSDSFLAAVPLALGRECPDSFVAVYRCASSLLMGVVVNRTLALSVRMAPDNPEALASHLERLRLYWSRHRAAAGFPGAVCCIGEDAPEGAGAKRFSVKAEGVVAHDEGRLAALGAALCLQHRSCTPRFPGPRPEASFRQARALIHACSAAALILTLAAAAVAGALALIAERSADSINRRYADALKSNKELRAGLKDAERIASLVLELESMSAQRTSWGRLLDELGRQMPAEVYLDKLGSQPVEGSENQIEIALAGWTTDEARVTEFISHLQKFDKLSDIKLASLQRARGSGTFNTFKVLCKLQLVQK